MNFEQCFKNGEIIFPVDTMPVSLQASRPKKDVITKAIRDITTTIPYLITSDVKIDITWYINEEERYESDAKPDIDNIIKPILDALSGPNGIIVDDCQVQTICSYWLDRYDVHEHIEIKIQFYDGFRALKNGILFVEFQKSLCLPINDKDKPESIKLLLEVFSSGLNTRDKLVSLGQPLSVANGVLPIQRLFHRSRVTEFRVISVKELTEKLNV